MTDSDFAWLIIGPFGPTRARVCEIERQQVKALAKFLLDLGLRSVNCFRQRWNRRRDRWPDDLDDDSREVEMKSWRLSMAAHQISRKGHRRNASPSGEYYEHAPADNKGDEQATAGIARRRAIGVVFALVVLGHFTFRQLPCSTR